jgi:hypothetical protein
MGFDELKPKNLAVGECITWHIIHKKTCRCRDNNPESVG